MQRQVWKTPKAGAIDRLVLQNEALPKLEAGKLRIEVKAVGLNFADIFALTGLYSATPDGAFIPGLEYSGIVMDAGDCSDFKVGDRVMAVTRFGGYASIMDTEPCYVLAMADDWNFEQAAAYLVQTLTAYYALTELGQTKPGQQVLIHSAAGGVGLQAMKLVKAMGGIPIGTVSSPKKQEALNEMGFEKVLVRESNFATQLKRDNLHFDLVLDGIGGAVQKASFDALSPMGRLVVFGAAEFTPGKNRPNYLSAIFKYLKRPKYDVMAMISDNKSVMGFNLIWLWQQVDFLTQLIAEMSEIELLAPLVGHEYDFKDAHDAIECLRSGKSLGKVVLKL